jgi:hypothetical protein
MLSIVLSQYLAASLYAFGKLEHIAIIPSSLPLTAYAYLFAIVLFLIPYGNTGDPLGPHATKENIDFRVIHVASAEQYIIDVDGYITAMHRSCPLRQRRSLHTLHHQRQARTS